MTSSLEGIGMTSRRTRERLVERLRAEGITDEQVLAVIAATPRHLFVDEALASRAYEDTALPIGHGQTLSQPYVVARMTELLLDEGSPSRVLEVGTGSGYQAAVLAQLVEAVFSVERLAVLAGQARRRLRELGLHNVRTKVTADGVGWPERGPYDGILVTAAAAEIPDALLAQLAPAGRLVMPVGGQAMQRLVVVRRHDDGDERLELEPVSFVPLREGGV